MADGTAIEWTEATWNPITGCSVHSPGCKNCYAMLLAGTRLASHPSRIGLTREVNGHHVWTGEVRINEQWLTQPLRWRRPRRIFVCAHADLFHENVPDAWIDRVFAVMALAPQHTFQVLTKRSARMRAWFVDRQGDVWDASRRLPRSSKVRLGFGGQPAYSAFTMPAWPLPNVWLGVSVEDQARADQRIPDLLATPAALRWISAEPLLGPLGLTRLRPPGCTWLDALTGTTHAGPSVFQEHARGIDWVVAGGESGPGARPLHPDWARALRDHCRAAGVAFFFKQWGAWEPVEGPTETVWHMVGKKRAGRLLDGELHDGFPGG